MIDALTQPFVEFAFMRRALVGLFALSVSAPPIGVFLMLRRMSLMGDAMSHAILPGAAVGFLLGGLSLSAMSLGGFIAGLTVALAAGLVAGAVTQLLQGILPAGIGSIANSATPWLAVAFGVGSSASRWWLAAISGAVTLLGALVGYWLWGLIGNGDTRGIDWIRWFISIAAAALFVVAYGAVTGKKQV